MVHFALRVRADNLLLLLMLMMMMMMMLLLLSCSLVLPAAMCQEYRHQRGGGIYPLTQAPTKQKHAYTHSLIL